MKQILFLLILFLSSQGLLAQIIPAQSNSVLLVKNKVKTLSVYYTQQNKDGDDREFLILKKEFDAHGKLIKKYMLYLWDAVSYSYTSYYTYDQNGRLTEELRIQEILNLFERDEHYIKSFGKDPLNEKITYTYDEQGNLTEKKIYVFNTPLLEENSLPRQTIRYEYDNGKLLREISASAVDCPCNKNYEIQYSYDSLGRLTDKLKLYGDDFNLKQNTHYVYDEEGRLLEEIITDSDLPHNNAHYRYVYDSTGRKAGRYIYSAEDEAFVLEQTYRYDKYGNPIPGNRNSVLTYLDNGLIGEETWVDDKTLRKNVFRTEYEFY